DAADSPYRDGVDPEEEKKRNPVSFVAASGRSLRVDFAVEHLISLKHGVTAALRVEPTVSEGATGRTIPPRQFRLLDDDDLMFIDRSTMDYGGLFMSHAEGPGRPALILPASFRTMGARKGRNLLVSASGGSGKLLKSAV